ncbi:hypothetical protein GCM10011428_15310 [Streptomyces violaceus]
MLLELSSLPHADSVRAAAAVSESAARRVGRRFTVGSRYEARLLLSEPKLYSGVEPHQGEGCQLAGRMGKNRRFVDQYEP